MSVSPIFFTRGIELVGRFNSEVRPLLNGTPTQNICDFVEFVLKSFPGRKIWSRDLTKVVKKLPEAQITLGSKGKRPKLINILRSNPKFSIGKKVTKPTAIVVVKNHDFVDPTGEFERIKSPNPEFAHVLLSSFSFPFLSFFLSLFPFLPFSTFQ